MNLTEYTQYDATGLAELVRKTEVTATELAENAREAAHLINPKINAVLEIFDDVVDDPYKDGMQRTGEFHGVPMLLKDALSGMQGRLHEMGCGLLKGNRKNKDDHLTRNRRAIYCARRLWRVQMK